MPKRTDRHERDIKATPERIYRALVDAGERLRWLPPKGMSGRFERFDPRPGGGYRMVLTYDDSSGAPGKSSAASDVVEARFVELVTDRKLVEAVDFESDDPAFAGTMTMTWLLEPIPGGTKLSIVAADVPEGISAEDHEVGLNSSLENLAKLVE